MRSILENQKLIRLKRRSFESVLRKGCCAGKVLRRVGSLRSEVKFLMMESLLNRQRH